MEEEWVKSTRKKLEELKKLNPKDRLGLVAACAQCASMINSSIGGWTQWLTNPVLLSEFDEETLRDFFNAFQKFAIEFLEFDVKATSKRKGSQRIQTTA